MTGAGVSARSWLRGERPTAAVRLLCLPHAGAGAASFNRWLGLFPPAIAPVRVQLPGREDVAAEPPLRRVHDVIDRLLEPVTQLSPVALYGHSTGALVAFELARALSGAGSPPVHLFVSGRRAPHLPARKAPIHHLPEPELAAALDAIGMGRGAAAHRSPAFLHHALPLIRADLELSEEYQHCPQPRLHCPVTAFHGTEDPVVDADQLHAWWDVTTGPFTVRTLPGDHFFHQRHRQAIVATMTAALV